MRRNLLALLSVVVLLFTTFAVAGAQGEGPLEPLTPAPSAENGELVNETPELWFVELASPPAADGTPLTTLQHEKAAFRDAARRAGLVYSERYAFDTLWNGLSISVHPSQLAQLRRLAGVKALYPVDTVSLPPTAPQESPELSTALSMTGADVAQSELGYTGKGIRVAVMDTGIDYHHPDLGGCFGEGCRVETGYDFVGDAFTAGRTPVPDDNPDDCQGHGTHVAGIVGASGAVTGVAPEVTFGAYRVFGCSGSTTADIMIAAMERALADNMQVLNMSIGSAFQWPQYPTAQASDRLVNKGMVVVASIGNSGDYGVYSAGAPGLGEKVIGVASFDNSHINVLSFSVNPGDRQVGYLPLSTTPDAPTSGVSPAVVYVGRGCDNSEVHDPYLADPNGKVALITRGACTFNEKYARAVAAGAVGVVIHNQNPGLFAGGGVVGIDDAFGIAISKTDGEHIRSLLTAGETVTLTWTDTRINATNPTGGLISSFSSYGLSPDLALKPDIGGPGGLIRSTYPLELGDGYAILSGTSMSAPHVAGGVALLLEARPNTPAQAVRGILQNSADPHAWWGFPGGPYLDNVHRQGAGMVDIDDAILSTTKIEPAKLSLGESEAGASVPTLTIENNGPAAVTYDLGHAPALSTAGSTFAPGFYLGYATVSFSDPSVTIPAGGTASVTVTITANPGLPDGGQYGGYIVFTPQDGGQSYRVPYAGFKGDYQAIQTLVPTPYGFPWLANSGFEKQADGAVFTMQSGDVPYILFHLDHQARRVRMEVFDAKTGKAWHRAFEWEYAGRNSTSTSVFSLAWDGVTTNGNRTQTVPDGQYVIKVSVQKALGDDNNPAHWETWTSPSFMLDRP